MNNIKKVHVVYKTHLDIGFTDLSNNVVENYIQKFIPKAIELAKKVNKENEEKKFIWTVGSWLIDEYLSRDDVDKKSLIEAINRGDIVWHGLPFTTHTELMDEGLFEFGVSISKDLEIRFNKKIIASKMTDVPGHTRGIIKILKSNNIEYLHIGVNDICKVPDVYDTFVWQDNDGNEIIVDYCQGYGKTTTINGFDEVLVFAHTGDNLGPPSEENIYKQIEDIKLKFPNATVKASTLDEYAKSLLKIKDKLPRIKQEIGDTWIHGVGTDPYKVSCFKELLRLKDNWIKEDKIKKDSKEYKSFMKNLVLIPEHTWGLDTKKYLSDYKNWDKESFKVAREKDIIQINQSGFEEYLEFAKEEYERQIHNIDWDKRTYSHFESSHQEQRNYILKAINVLSENLREEAIDAINKLRIIDYKFIGEEIHINENININDFNIYINENGILDINLLHKEENLKVGKISYEAFGIDVFKSWKDNYLVNLEQNILWGIPDQFKLGFEKQYPVNENIEINPTVKKISKENNKIKLKLEFDEESCNKFGCPSIVLVSYEFLENEINAEVDYLNKEANRLPEAIWYSPIVENDNIDDIVLNKLGEDIKYNDIVKFGNRNYHAVDNVDIRFKNSNINVMPLDSPLVSIGEKRIYNFDQNFADIKNGVHFNIYNNTWNTNFKMWYEENIKSRFKIKIR